ncbi:MAG: cob(I)yrinic acid a,c-diamide adenosyltransferase [Bacteroidetes bacterium]|nr:cob(I)yrinic acid a,c-diamide adenosyltransferase [Bacteroidota bacterium]
MKIYTKTGDKGETSLFGGQRVSKDNLRIASYGTVDELNSILGIAASHLQGGEFKNLIMQLQNDLFNVGADLATPMDKTSGEIIRVDGEGITFLEETIDEWDAKVPALKNFVLPGGSTASSYLHFARTVCRRAEREVVKLSKEIDIGSEVIIYLNRLSDLLFVLARYANVESGTPDVEWQKQSMQ